MKTIGRNSTRKIADIRSRIVSCQVKSIRNDFTAKDCDADYAFGDLEKFQFARLQEKAPGRYVITVHGNLWYELETAA